MALNVIVVAGNLTRDADLRMTQSGNPVLNFTVAVNNRRRRGDEYVDEAAFVPCVMFGQRAQSLAQHLTKGLKVGVTGRINESRWEDAQTGQKRSRLEIYVNEVEFLTPKGAGQGGYQSNPQPAPVRSQAYHQTPPAPSAGPTQGRITGADDVPFY